MERHTASLSSSFPLSHSHSLALISDLSAVLPSQHVLTHGHHGKNTTVSCPSQLRAARNAPICRPEAVESEDMTTILCKIGYGVILAALNTAEGGAESTDWRKRCETRPKERKTQMRFSDVSPDSNTLMSPLKFQISTSSHTVLRFTDKEKIPNEISLL